MRKRGLLPAGLLLFMSAGLLARVPSGFPGKTPGQGQSERPKFYALRVVFEKKVQNAKDSLSAPDGRYAEILPGGQFIVFMENKLYPFPILGTPEGGYGQIDSGSVVGKGEADFGLEGWFPMQDTQDKQHYAWIPLGLSVSGFCVWPTYDMGVDMIRITNIGTKSLFVDAVIGYDRKRKEDRRQ
jgi:hypothetical protein